MAVISADTFDPMRRFVRVRLQQGVPIVDADVNEREDIQKFEMRAFLKWFVGDGVPEGNDGFRIVGTGQPNDFEIRSGVNGAADPLHQIGRYLAEGLDVMIEADKLYTAQDLHEDKGASAKALAAAWDVPVIPKLESVAGPVILVFLDVWERLVTPDEDPRLIFAGLGTESCARHKREWAVRARTGTDLPKKGDLDFKGKHAYTPLALVERRANDPQVRPTDVTDQRQQRLLVPPASLIQDVLGTSPADYRRGEGRPPVSLRNAINALLRGELPSTPDAPVSASNLSQVMNRAFVIEPNGGLVASWYGEEAGGVEQVFVARLDLAGIQAGFVGPSHPLQQVTSGGTHVDPHLVALPGGELLIAYRSGLVGSASVTMKQAPLGQLSATAEIPVADTSGVDETLPFVTLTGEVATVFFHHSATNRWHYRRWRHTNRTWVDAAGAVKLSDSPAAAGRGFHAAVDPGNKIWTGFAISDGVQAMRFNPDTGVSDHEHEFPATGADDPFMLATREGDAWLFWVDNGGNLHAVRFHGTDWEEENIVVLADSAGAKVRSPCAVEDPDGGVWLFWSRGQVGEGDLFVMRRDPVSGGWGGVRQLTTTPGDDVAPFTLIAPDNTIWIFWTSVRSGTPNVYYKRLVTAV
ncbi:DUF6519 domain-containing protein [Streptomyces sp. NPDC004609]|uniref:DUF6519 domain-containing protein n=1 Tax=Streptomyces sp. NPDC004609 TaxID=3364704 RepID=UPI0036ACD9DD